MQVSEQVQQAKVDKAEFRVSEMQDSIKKLSITAPKDGMVSLVANGEEKTRDW